MAVKCGNCKQHHETTDEVRRCYKFNGDGIQKVTTGPVWPASEKQIQYVLDLQASRATPDTWVDYSRDTLGRLEKDEVSAIITMLLAFPNDPHQPKGVVPDVPAGRYALYREAGPGYRTGSWSFFEVQDGKGRWDGYKFLKRLIGAPGSYRKEQMGRVERGEVMKEIESDPRKASLDFGRESGICGVCGSPLTNADSLASGIGPICAAKTGW